MEIYYEFSFASAVDQINKAVNDWRIKLGDGRLQVSQLPGCVFLKNQEMEVIDSNAEFVEFFGRYSASTGKRGFEFLDISIAEVSKRTDDILTDGLISTIEFSHIGLGQDGIVYELRTFKTMLRDGWKTGVAMIGFSRKIRSIQCDDEPQTILRFAAYVKLDKTNKRICESISQGLSTKEIASLVGLSRRAVQLRRNQIIQEMGLESQLDIVKSLVRFETRGFFV